MTLFLIQVDFLAFTDELLMDDHTDERIQPQIGELLYG